MNLKQYQPHIKNIIGLNALFAVFKNWSQYFSYAVSTLAVWTMKQLWTIKV